jgi:hypothetical protein
VIALAEPIVEEWKRRNARDPPARASTMAKLWADYLIEAKNLILTHEALVERGQERKWPLAYQQVPGKRSPTSLS